MLADMATGRCAAIAEPRLSLTPSGNVRYQLNTPYRNGTMHVIFEPLDSMARLAALVPRPRVNLTRYHGVFAPNSPHRAPVTKAGRGLVRCRTGGADGQFPGGFSRNTWVMLPIFDSIPLLRDLAKRVSARRNR